MLIFYYYVIQEGEEFYSTEYSHKRRTLFTKELSGRRFDQKGGASKLREKKEREGRKER